MRLFYPNIDEYSLTVCCFSVVLGLGRWRNFRPYRTRPPIGRCRASEGDKITWKDARSRRDHFNSGKMLNVHVTSVPVGWLLRLLSLVKRGSLNEEFRVEQTIVVKGLRSLPGNDAKSQVSSRSNAVSINAEMFPLTFLPCSIFVVCSPTAFQSFINHTWLHFQTNASSRVGNLNFTQRYAIKSLQQHPIFLSIFGAAEIWYGALKSR